MWLSYLLYNCLDCSLKDNYNWKENLWGWKFEWNRASIKFEFYYKTMELHRWVENLKLNQCQLKQEAWKGQTERSLEKNKNPKYEWAISFVWNTQVNYAVKDNYNKLRIHFFKSVNKTKLYRKWKKKNIYLASFTAHFHIDSHILKEKEQ
jgi:hypothetical protein